MLRFDLARLWRMIDVERAARGMTWASLSREVRVSAATIRRLARAEDAEADGILALVGWLGVAPEEFVVTSTVDGSPLPPAGDGMLRVDMKLVAELSGWPRGGQDRSRTTIQRLVGVAQRSGRAVASLTRWSSD